MSRLTGFTQVFLVFCRVEWGPCRIGEGDGVESVSDSHGFFKVAGFTEFYFDSDFFLESSGVAIELFFFADGWYFKDDAGECCVVGFD